jgi:type IX secretion system PorP/SprF family membrane protein
MKNFGIGVSVIKDQVGPLQSNSLNFSGAYHLRLNNSWKFSTGLKLTAMEQNVILSELTTTQSDDPDMQENLTTGLTYNAGFGFLLYSSKLFLGASLPRVASIKYSRVDMTNFVDKKGGCIVYAGGNVKIKEKLDFRPSAITYFGYGGPLNLDLNASFTIHKKYDFGISYQLRGSLGAILGMNIKDKFYVGYTYVYPLSQLNTVSTQSHELALRFMFKKPLSSADSPRFFN